jgi:murein DD-endopeptidase MepM/ murein hydrolase activator NlpD
VRLIVGCLGLLVVAGCDVGGTGDVNASARNGGLGGGTGSASEETLLPSPYRAPWTCGEKYYVSQGNDGDLCSASNGDHVFVQNYAWDFALPRHTPVLASRGGKVTVATNIVHEGTACFDGCPSAFASAEFVACCSACLLLSNRVNIDHGDGTVATYWHLDVATVHIGQQVQAGDLLGYSGTSGCSTGPHLHFQVMADCPTGYCQSKEIVFAESGIPSCGDHVTSRNHCD